MRRRKYLVDFEEDRWSWQETRRRRKNIFRRFWSQFREEHPLIQIIFALAFGTIAVIMGAISLLALGAASVMWQGG